MAEMFKALMMGLGCLMTLWLGSCTLFGVGTVVAVNTAAQIAEQKRQARLASEEAAGQSGPIIIETKTPSKWDRNAAQPYTPSYHSSSWSREARKIDGKPITNPNNYDDY